MRELTKEEALELLTRLEEEENYIGRGSSRAVFEFKHEGKAYAVKVAGDAQGRFQNDRERTLWLETESEYLAPVEFYYDDVIIAFPIVLGCEDLADYIYESGIYDSEDLDDREDFMNMFDIEEDELDNTIELFQNCVNFLSDYQGETSDNCQVGWLEGRIVAYDYGYTTYDDRHDQVGDMDSYYDECSSINPLWMIAREYIESYEDISDDQDWREWRWEQMEEYEDEEE